MGLIHHQPPRLTLPAPHGTDELLAVLRAADVRGHGGAGFPTATKIASAVGQRPVLIVNACDGEPLVAKDTVLLARSPGLVADGAALVARALDAREVVLAAHSGSRSAASLHGLVATDGRLLPRPRVMEVRARYVSSEESALASRALGGQARPVHRTALLTQGGVGRTPVLVLNAETLAQVALVWSTYVTTGQVHPPATRLVTASGEVRHPGVIEVRGDFALADLLAPGSRPRALLVGGYGGTWLDWDVARRLTLDGLAAEVGLGAGLLHVLGAECPVDVVGGILRFLADASAGQCGPCMFGLPAIAEDWGQLRDPYAADAALERLRRRLPVIAGRGACRHPDGAVRQAASALTVFGPHLDLHRSGRCVPPDAAPAGGTSQLVGVS